MPRNRVKYPKPVTTGDGAVNPSAQVYIRPRGSLTATADVYAASSGGSPLSQPLTPAANGHLDVWAEAGRYDIEEHHGPLIIRREWEAFATQFSVWTNLTLFAPWTALTTGTYGTPGYSISSEGYVILRGVVTTGSTATAIAALPSEARPNVDLAGATTSGANMTVWVLTASTGNLSISASPGGVTAVTLGSITYAAGAGWSS